jgi:hypothetical protein
MRDCERHATLRALRVDCVPDGSHLGGIEQSAWVMPTDSVPLNLKPRTLMPTR